MTRVIGVTGGKGGTGKSTVATALAMKLSEKGRVLLVDADVDCPNDHLLLGIKRKKVKTVYQRIPKFDMEKCKACGECAKACRTNAIVSVKKPIFIQSQCNGCGACQLVCPYGAISYGKKETGWIYSGKKEGLNLLSGELKVSEAVSELVVDELKKEINKEEYDHIIIDTAAGAHCDVITALEDVDIAFAVTEPTPLGKHDASLILKLLDILGKEKYLVLNRADIGDKNLIEIMSKENGAPIVCEIPYSKEIIKAYSNAGKITGRWLDELIIKVR